ncbi:MAG: Ig-like domain-containing protein [Planctomycetaceae bacterium]|nr:Ig-like domain-containing protein [Planctomycetaceae bacterium]
MKTTHKTAWMFLGLSLLLFAFGCAKDVPKGFPALHPCTITVMQDGAPLAGASVLFKPTQYDSLSASGKTDEKGVAVMMVQATYEGVPAGKYKVMVVKQTRERNPAVKDEDIQGQNVSLEMRDKAYIVTNFVDPKYGDSSKTPLEIQVTEGKNEQTFEVQKPGT